MKMNMKMVKLVFFMLINMQGIAIAQTVKTPIEKSESNNHPPLKSSLSQVYGGEGVDQYNLGYNYLVGKGVKQSNKKAKKWFDLAAKSNVPAVRYKIGRLFETGTLYQQSYHEAVKHYRFAAYSGDIYGKNNLAILYLNGTGVAKDVDKGITLFTQAAERGNAESQVNLGLIYLNGTGVPKDIKKAFTWFKEAAKDNNPTALYYLAEHAFAEKDYVKAYDYYLDSAQQSNDDAQLKLAMLYAKGLGIKKDSSIATDWLTKAAKLGNKQAIAMLKNRK